MTLREALRHGVDQLKKHRCAGTDPVRESEALLRVASRLPGERFITDPDRRLPAPEGRRFASLLSRRRRHEPLAYLLGTAWFMGREFAVDRRALIPRPATEIIAAMAFDAAKARRAALLVDVGTGSGCIAITAALTLTGTAVAATDTSSAALALARKNARLHRTQVDIRKGDLFMPARAAARRARGPIVIIANLPYIPSRSMRMLAPDVRREPKEALAGGTDGLTPSRRLLVQLGKEPHPPSDVYFEILPQQVPALTKAIHERFPQASCTKIRNHQGVIVGLHARLS